MTLRKFVFDQSLSWVAQRISMSLGCTEKKKAFLISMFVLFSSKIRKQHLNKTNIIGIYDLSLKKSFFQI